MSYLETWSEKFIPLSSVAYIVLDYVIIHVSYMYQKDIRMRRTRIQNWILAHLLECSVWHICVKLVLVSPLLWDTDDACISSSSARDVESVARCMMTAWTNGTFIQYHIWRTHDKCPPAPKTKNAVSYAYEQVPTRDSLRPPCSYRGWSAIVTYILSTRTECTSIISEFDVRESL